MTGINVDDVKKYNESLRAQQERASNIKAEIEFNNKELTRLCEELTKELGISVTADNIEQIYTDRVEKINNTLQNGNEILKRIASDEEALNIQSAVQNEQVTGAVKVSAAEAFGSMNTPGFAPASPLGPAPTMNPGAMPLFSQSAGPVFHQGEANQFAGLDGGSSTFGQPDNKSGTISI